MAAGKASGWIGRTSFSRWLDGIAGLFFLGLAARIALTGRGRNKSSAKSYAKGERNENLRDQPQPSWKAERSESVGHLMFRIPGVDAGKVDMLGWTAPAPLPLCHSGMRLETIEEQFMKKIATIGLDLAKNVFVRPASRVSFCFTGGDIA
ncbi:hypothetical protein HGO38_23880 [Rhizobium sp. CG5]|nr:hypothetical protein [Rhizobium sp. CG5]